MKEYAIEVVRVSKSYAGMRGAQHRVVVDLSLAVRAGTVFGFLGPNGAGKTTTMKMLVGLAFPDEGRISVHGASPSSREVKRRIGFMPEAASFYSYLTGKELLVFMADLFGIEQRAAAKKINELLEKVNLADAKNIQIRKYSKGMGQRLGLAQALINDPDIIFLDEPFDGLDPLGRVEAKQLLLELKAAGKTIFFNSHILSDAEEICDEVGIIDRGKLIVDGTVKDVVGRHRTLEEAFVSIIHAQRAA